MSDIAVGRSDTNEVSEKPVPEKEELKFPPFPDPKDDDFDEDIPEEERNHYKTLYKDLNTITSTKLHCTACDRHLGCSARNDSRMRTHPMLRTLVCQTCHTFYNSGEFEKGDDGSELYCRWCGQGGQVYCCADCPHVFCAKCIKRNLGTPKIKEIEQLDDWKCFKCNNKCLWDLRALCWAVIRYCDLKNKITYSIEDPALKEACQISCAQDFSECCKNKTKRREKQENKKKEAETSKKVAASLGKLPPTIQVKKFASINMEEIKPDKKAQKRPASPKNKIIVKNPITIPNKMLNNQLNMPSLPKKIRMSNSPVINPIRFNNDRKLSQNFSCYSRIRPKAPQMPLMYNGFNSTPTFSADNINLSLESLTQGLDMSAMASLSAPASMQDDDVVCTPDFPLEPLCEVTEDNGDDDVQCITPGPVAAPKPAPIMRGALSDLNPDNIIQMTDNDVTVNSNTGGLKFRVDPQTLSSNKMYRLPDGRIFAINANPNMPGGYSATIVAVTDNNVNKGPSKGTTFAAKLSAVPAVTTPPLLKLGNRNQPNRNSKRSTPKSPKVSKASDKGRSCDLNVPVEWYRYNLVDAIDALEYSLSRLHQLKKDATTMHLRTRSINEMRVLHRSLERAMSTSMTRFKEIRDNLNKEYRQYVLKKTSSTTTSVNNSDDDDVEILPEDDNDDPIYIDENSMESNQNDNQEVDLTVVGSSDFNDSSDRSIEKIDASKDPLSMDLEANSKGACNESDVLDKEKENGVTDNEHLEENNLQSDFQKDEDKNVSDENEPSSNENIDSLALDDGAQKESNEKNEISTTDMNGQNEKPNDVPESEIVDKLDEENILDENSGSEKKTLETEMSEEMIEDLLKDESIDSGNDAGVNCDKAAENLDDSMGIGDDVLGIGDNAIGIGDDAVGIGDDAMEIGDDAIENGEEAAGNGDDAAGNGHDTAGKGDDAAGKNNDAAGKSDDAAGKGDDIQNVHSLDENQDVNKESEKD
ncbi:uncharacterized protein LOC112052208 [Bicyclus anynana]|uniref:Uncharacterized protein LOC112052208 n=1 Tax=Bicyclus anynana TaxID=110368 RepID=A0A6J1NPG4_BICAN|nr:uncharacterized protein LOC112052208 [Bicyclus anynana]